MYQDVQQPVKSSPQTFTKLDDISEFSMDRVWKSPSRRKLPYCLLIDCSYKISVNRLIFSTHLSQRIYWHLILHFVMSQLERRSNLNIVMVPYSIHELTSEPDQLLIVSGRHDLW